MATNMMHRNNWNIQCQCGGFCKVYTHQERTDEARSIGNGDGIQISLGNASLFDCFICKTGNGLDMFSGCNFRHNTPIDGVHIDLTQNAV